MSKKFVTSDLHFEHKRIVEYNPSTRPWSTMDAMESGIVTEWNTTATDDDEIFILGDVAFSSAEKAANIIQRMVGKKHLIVGNHDASLLRFPVFTNLFESIQDYQEIRHDGEKIIMCHYPIFDHNGCSRGSIMLHGHRHGKPTGIPGRIMDVGLDATGKVLTNLDDIVAKMRRIEPMRDHHWGNSG